LVEVEHVAPSVSREHDLGWEPELDAMHAPLEHV
jgi:hypothetical protein